MTLPDTTWVRADAERFEAMKHLRIEGVTDFARMTAKLRELGMQSCPNCGNTEYERTIRDGSVICTTCENTVMRFWQRNVSRLAPDEVPLVAARFEYEEGVRRAALYAWRKRRTISRSRTIKRSWIEPVPGQTFTLTIDLGEGPREVQVKSEQIAAGAKVVTETVREEGVLNPEMLSIYLSCLDKLARVQGLNVSKPALPKPQRKKLLNVRLRSPAGEPAEPTN